MQSEDYTLVLFGKGEVTMTVYVPPLSNTPSSPVPEPLSQKRIQLNPGDNTATITTDLIEGTAQGYILSISAGQNLTIKSNSMLNVAVLDPQSDPLTLESPRPGVWIGSILEAGDYLIVVLGQGSASISIEISPA